MLKEAKELAAKKKIGRQLIMRKRQGLLIIMDGLGDRPDPVLGGIDAA